jgi:drug/metabolite transporter (DMT)-like permease
MSSQGIRLSAALTFIGYVVLVLALLRWTEGMTDVVLWATSPLALPLIAVFAARKRRAQMVALALLLGLGVVGAVLLTWGLAWNRGDYNHLVVVFLPFYHFGFLMIAVGLLAFATLLRRFTRKTKRSLSAHCGR